MPFTPSHAAAVVPLLRTPLPASALVIGSMAPDVPYYLPGDPGWRTHTALGVVSSDVLIGLVVWALWHGLLAAPALASAPGALRARLERRVPMGLRPRLDSAGRIALLLGALVLGAATHVLWDEFTHDGRWGTRHVPALAARWGPLAGYSWAQHLSTLAGAAVLSWWLARWWRRTPALEQPAVRSTVWPWALLAGVAVVIGVTGALAAPGLRRDGFVAATWGLGAAGLVAVVLAVGWHLRRRPAR